MLEAEPVGDAGQRVDVHQAAQFLDLRFLLRDVADGGDADPVLGVGVHGGHAEVEVPTRLPHALDDRRDPAGAARARRRQEVVGLGADQVAQGRLAALRGMGEQALGRGAHRQHPPVLSEGNQRLVVRAGLLPSRSAAAGDLGGDEAEDGREGGRRHGHDHPEAELELDGDAADAEDAAEQGGGGRPGAAAG